MKNKYIIDLAEALSNNHAALMVGSGFSKNAEKISMSNKEFLDWNQLSDKFYTSIYGENDNSGKAYCSSLRLAQEVEVLSGRAKLEEIIKDAVPDLDYAPSNLYVNLMQLPWVDVFTTNYDTLLERSLENVVNRRYNIVTCQEDLVNSSDAPRIIKLHGSFPSHRPFIITEEDYRTYPSKFAAFVNTVQQALLENVFCMLGFSCEDPNFLKWIGWIRDNLGKGNSQKIYMIAVSHISEASSRLLFEQNIVVVDLEEIWPDKNISERISSFLNELQLKVEKKERENKWFDIREVRIEPKTSIKERIGLLNNINNTYPGWIFLPWKMKGKVSYILDEICNDSQLKKSAIDEQIEFIYEYARFSDIAGRPILVQTAEFFWQILNDSEEKISNKEKLQKIYLQLLRTYRELADWTQYDECHNKINSDILNYDDRQFLYACDWWSFLYRFDDKNLKTVLDQWKLSKNDLYWPLIKSSMYSIIGEYSSAEEILKKNLVLVRQQLIKNENKEYLSSIEESCVSLINFIRQRNISFTENFEETVNGSDLSWWDENDKYCLNLRAKNKSEQNSKIVNFDLSVTYKTQLATNNTAVFYALEYLRFLETTGHPFRLGCVTNTKGLYDTISNLASYYPHWCLMNIFIAQDDKHLDLFFGRAQLAKMTQEEVDGIAKEYLRIIQDVITKVDPKNHFYPNSIYEQSANVLPKIIARLCYKCSLGVLDLILDSTLELCNSNVKFNFRGIKHLLKGLLNSYNTTQQMERIEKILSFPMLKDIVREYHDPIIYLRKPLMKIKLNNKLYKETINEIIDTLRRGDEEQKRDARNRMLVLMQIAEIEESDKETVFESIQKDNNSNKFLLHYFKKNKDIEEAKAIFNNIINTIESDAKNIGTISSGSCNYSDAIPLIDELDLSNMDFAKVFDVFKQSVEKYIKWSKKDFGFSVDEKIRSVFQIAIKMLLNKKSKVFTNAEIDSISSYFELTKKYYNSPVCEIIKEHYANDSNLDLKNLFENLWMLDEDGIMSLVYYYDFYNFIEIPKDSATIKLLKECFRFSVCKIINSIGRELYLSLQLCHSILRTKGFSEDIDLLVLELERLAEKTLITKDDSEDEAISKLTNRIWCCQIAKLLYNKGIKHKNVLLWYKISKSNDEFAEIRKIDFDANSSEYD